MSNTTTSHPETEDERPVLSLSITALAAGALAAVTSAIIGSQLGTAGTLTGAALGSVIGAASTALYTFGLQRSWHALSRMNPRRARLVVGVLLTAVAAFVVALVLITGLEKATGTSLSGQPGTTVSQVRAASQEGASDADPAVVAEESASPTPAATASATPAASATPEPTASAADASAEPTPAVASQPEATTAAAAVSPATGESVAAADGFSQPSALTK